MRPELEEAIVLLRRGDAESVQRALELLQQTVLSFGFRVCGHREDAEDTAQEVLFRALPHLAGLQDARALSAWLYTAARNRCLQDRRRATRKHAVALEDVLPPDSEPDSLLLADPAANPEDQARSRQDYRLVHTAVLALPPQYRLVLVLHDLEELDTELVARILDLQPGTVRVRLHRARALLRRQMSALLEGGEEAERGSGKPGSASCSEVLGNLSEYLDERLATDPCTRMRARIEECPACIVFMRELKRVMDHCRSLDRCPESVARPILQRLLTEEYFRLKNSSPAL